MPSVKGELKQISDQELFSRIALRNANAFSELYDRHSAKLYGLAMKILRDKEKANDILQELFIILWNKIPDYDVNSGNPTGWMMILCRNRCIDKIRSISAKESKNISIDENVRSLPSLDGSANPQKSTDYKEIHQKINKALDELPENQKELIYMAYYKGYTQNEISRKADLPIGTVKSRIRSGMQKLKQLLQNEE